MLTLRKLALVTAVSAGLLASFSALASDVSSDRRQPAPSADQAAKAPDAAAHACSCAHRS